MMSVVYHQVHLSRIHAHIASIVLIERYNNLMIEPSLHEFDPTYESKLLYPLSVQ